MTNTTPEIQPGQIRLAFVHFIGKPTGKARPMLVWDASGNKVECLKITSKEHCKEATRIKIHDHESLGLKVPPWLQAGPTYMVKREDIDMVIGHAPTTLIDEVTESLGHIQP